MIKIKYKNVKEIVNGKVVKVPIDSEIAPKKIRNCLIAIIFRENKGAFFKKIKNNKEDFKHKGHFYFIVPTAIYLCYGQRYSIYLEGVSTPLSHANIEYEIKEREIINPMTNEKEKRQVRLIKGLKYDSKLLEVLVNSKLAQIFLRIKENWILFFMFVLILVSVVLSGINIYVAYTHV